MIGIPGPGTDSTIQGYNTFGSAQPFRLDEANGRKSAPARPLERPPAGFFARICAILYRLYLAGGTSGREMRHSVYRSSYLSRDTAG